MKDICQIPYRSFKSLIEVDLTYVLFHDDNFAHEEGTILNFDPVGKIVLFEPHYSDERWEDILDMWRLDGKWDAESDRSLERLVEQTGLPKSAHLTHRKQIPLHMIRSIRILATGKVETFSDLVVPV